MERSCYGANSHRRAVAGHGTIVETEKLNCQTVVRSSDLACRGDAGARHDVRWPAGVAAPYTPPYTWCADLRLRQFEPRFNLELRVVLF